MMEMQKGNCVLSESPRIERRPICPVPAHWPKEDFQVGTGWRSDWARHGSAGPSSRRGAR